MGLNDPGRSLGGRGAGMVAGFDGGGSKSDLVLASLEGEPVAYVRGPGSNSHAIGPEAVGVLVARMVEAAGLGDTAEAAVFYCSGADLPEDLEGLFPVLSRSLEARKVVVDNDTFALLHAGRCRRDAVAVVCGAGINVVGESAAGCTVRYPGLGWETGDWGGSEMLGREALFLAARGRDGRGPPTVLADILEEHFGVTLERLGVALHFRRLPIGRLGEVAPAIVAAATHDEVAALLLDRLAGEVAKMARKALAGLGLLERAADVVLGGGMLGPGPLEQLVRTKLAELAPNAQARWSREPPVVGSVARALELAGAEAGAVEYFRRRFPLPGTPLTIS